MREIKDRFVFPVPVLCVRAFGRLMENAELYSSANGMQKKDAKEILTEFRDKLKWTKEARILDIGCGSGEVTTKIILPQLPKDFSELVGVDISTDMIQYARNFHFHPKVSFVEFDIAGSSDDVLEELTKATKNSRNGDLLNLKRNNTEITSKSQNIKILLNNQKILDYKGIPSQGHLYDVICSFYCLHWIPDQRLAIRNIYKLLKPGGEALLVFLARSPIFTLYRKLSTLHPWRNYMQDVENFIPFYQDSDDPLTDFLDIVTASGFRIATLECRDKNYAFNGFVVLRDSIRAVNPFVSRIPHDLQEDFIDECLHQTKVLKLAEFKNDTYRVSYKLIVAHIQKPS